MKVYCLPKVLASENMEVLTVYRWFSLLSLKKKILLGERCGPSVMSARLETVVGGPSEKYSFDLN